MGKKNNWKRARPFSGWLALAALVACCAPLGSAFSANDNNSCAPTTITPYVQVDDGNWQQTASVTVDAGAKVKFGPQPIADASWSWSGAGTSTASRERTIYPATSVTATATYTNNCGAESTQNFTVNVNQDSTSSAHAIENGRYNIVSSLSGLYLDVYGARMDDGTDVVQYTNNGGANQQFDVSALGDGTYSIRAAHSGKAVEVYQGNASDGAELRQGTYIGGLNQRWRIDDVGDGVYSITSALSDKVIDVWEMNTEAGGEIKLYGWWGGSNQQWSFVKVGDAPNPAPSPAPGPAPTQCSTAWDTIGDKGDGVALTPPMGWNSWNVFHENINETQIKQIADAMVSSGMKDAGYQYINLDDNWMAARQNGKMMVDRSRFPNGIDGLADYIHGLGLKLGIYGDRGVETCHNYNNRITKNSGSYGHEEDDAKTFASWGVDYLKYDNCAPAPGRGGDQAQREDYEAMASALRETGRPIVFSICAWDYKSWMPSVGHLWRSTFDIGPCFSGANGCSSWYRNIDQIIDENNDSPDAAGPGHWNDPDMLEVGNSGLSDTEATAHFSMWAIMAAPLIAGNDLRNMSDTIRNILTNQEVIDVNQDPAGIQGTRVVDHGDQEVWLKPLCTPDGTEKAVALFNRSGGTSKITVSFSDIGISGAATVRDLWAHQDMGEFNGSYSADVPSHGVVMLKIIETNGK